MDDAPDLRGDLHGAHRPHRVRHRRVRPAAGGPQTLLKAFWENHDPTQVNGQGNDVGTQYRSAIFPTTQAQLAAAEASRDQYQAALAAAGHGEISTQITPSDEAGDGTFYWAEDYPQQYLDKHPNGYCNHGFCQVAYDAAGHGQAGGPQLPRA